MSDKTDNPAENAEHMKATDVRKTSPPDERSERERALMLDEAKALMSRRRGVFWLLLVFACSVLASFVLLLLAVYVGWPKLSLMAGDPQSSSLSVNIFISGTFISVIAVFTFARNILDPVAGKRDKNKSTGLIDAVRRVVGPAD